MKSAKPQLQASGKWSPTKKDTATRPGYGKTGRSLRHPKSKPSRRVLDIPRELMQDLRLWKVQCPVTPQMLVMATAEKKPLEQKALQAMMDAASERAGVRRLPSHRLRHTFGSLLIKASGDRDIPKLSRLLGQDNVAFSIKIYTHFIPDQDNTMQDFAIWIAARAGGKKN